jgi:hypothetical protein
MVVGKAIDARFKLGIVAILALASAAYYYLVYLPDRHAPIDVEKQDFAQPQKVQKSEAQARYQNCLAVAQHTYTSTWANNCMAIRAKSINEQANCMASGGERCDTVEKDTSSNCALPRDVADRLNSNLYADRHRCLQETRAQ